MANDRYTERSAPLTANDISRIQQHIATVPFLHLQRVSTEFGLSVDVLRRVASRAIAARPRY